MFATEIQHELAPEQWEADVEMLLNTLNPWLQKHHTTCLLAATEEPYYRPKADGREFDEIQFAHGYFNSALHELAHWCIAGPARRRLPDYGYWYEPDGRTAEQQKEFERVEVKPQAIEWHLSQACGRVFRVSVDNLSGEATDSGPFTEAVSEQACRYQAEGLPDRADALVGLLAEAFGQERSRFQFDCSGVVSISASESGCADFCSSDAG